MAVAGRSMVPTLLAGDHVLVVPLRRARVGDLVVLWDPTEATRLVIKRVAGLPGEAVTVDGVSLAPAPGLVVVGDNPAESTDSRSYGRVGLDRVAGRAWYRYAPTERAGRLRRPDAVSRRAADRRPG